MRIALTGGSGRVGQAVAEAALARGHALVSIDRILPPVSTRHAGVRYLEADVVDFEALHAAFAGCDALIHLAAIPHPRGFAPQVVHNNNVVGSYNAMLAAVENGIRRICQASSVNAIGQAFSRAPRYDYFPLDEDHPNYCEDAYSLSKWIAEQQADAFARRYADISIASLRFHWVVPERAVAAARYADPATRVDRYLWGYTRRDAAAAACLRAVEADLAGHEVFYVTAPDTASDLSSRALAARHFPTVPIRGPFPGRASFMSSAKAERLLFGK